MEKLTKQQVLHVAELAKIEVTEEEIESYQVQLQDILTEIDKIVLSPITTTDMMISPITHRNDYRKDEVKDMLEQEAMFRNANKVIEDYIVVPKVIHDELFES